jgi:uncharacterized membrane protein
MDYQSALRVALSGLKRIMRTLRFEREKEKNMRSGLIISASALGLLAVLTMPAQPAKSPHYNVTDLGPPGNPFSVASALNNHGVITGSDTVFDAAGPASHAVLWYRNSFIDLKQMADIRQPGLLGPNSAAGPVNESGQVVVGAETLLPDPNNENFCGYGTGLQCVTFVWNNGVMTQLPNPLGGTNNAWGGMNHRGELAGFAENTVRDPECLAMAPNGTGPQVLDYKPVIWGPAAGQFRQLNLLSGDSVGIALGINDAGQVVGISGRCGNTVIPGFTTGPHAVLWEADGSVHEIHGFGGTSNPAVLAVGNAAFAINNKGEVVGTSALPGNMVNQPFLWTKEKGTRHLPLLSGDIVGAGLGINSRGEVVGASISPGGPATGHPSAVVWPNGADGGVTDLNTSLAAGSPFFKLLQAFAINDAGEIVGLGVSSAGGLHAFLATPAHGEAGETAGPDEQRTQRTITLPESARWMIGRGFAMHK